MSGSPVAPVSVAPISVAAAALRVEILGAAEAELLAVLGATQEIAAEPQPTRTATPPDPVRQAVDSARTTAASGQASLAPLFADLAETLSVPNLPAPIKAAIGQVLALQLPASGPIVPQDVQQAVARSGLFLEANLAAAPADDPAPPDLKTALLTLQQALPASPPPDAPATTRQATPPAADAAPPPESSALETPRPQEPAPRQPVTAAPSVSANPSAPTAPLASADLPTLPQPPRPQTAQTSPAPPSTEPTPTPASTASPQPGATKAVIDPAPAPQPAAGGAATPAPVRTAVAQPGPLLEPALAAALPEDAAPLDPKAALLTLQQAPPSPPAAGAPAPTPRTPPPVRDAALSPQAPAPATLPPGAGLATLVQHLRPQVEQALARLALHQLASLPEAASATWMFELPVATPQGTAMAQFQIERDAPHAGAAEAAGAAPWRARFSIDMEPLGPVHVHLAMSGGKAAVSVWAEREDSLQRLRDEGGELARALSAEVVFRPGSPGGAAPARGHFLDQTS